MSSSTSPSSSNALLTQWGCAAVAAGIAETLTMPLDVTKTRLQLQNELGQKMVSHAPTRGMIATAVGVYREEGVRALFTGLPPAVIRQAIVAGMGIAFYPSIKEFYLEQQRLQAKHQMDSAAVPELTISTKILAGATSGAIGQFFAAPTDVVKIRLQADKRLILIGKLPRYNNSTDALVKIVHEEGVKTLFKGLSPSLQRSAAMYGATIPSYDLTKQYIVASLYEGDKTYNDKMTTHMMSSSVSGLMASLVSTPFDTIKTRIINQPAYNKKLHHHTAISTSTPASTSNSTPSASYHHHAHAKPLYSSTWDCVWKTVRSEGPLALYKGFLPTYGRLAPWQLTFFVVFEQLSLALTGQSFGGK